MDTSNSRSMPKVSVLVSAYDRTVFLEHALRSILSQTIAPSLVETVLVTNLSPQALRESPAVSRLLDVLRVRIANSDSRYFGTFRAVGIEQCHGDVVCFLDDDDVWDTRRLEIVSREFSQLDTLIYFHNSQFFIDRAGCRLSRGKGLELLHHFSVAKWPKSVSLSAKSALSHLPTLANLDAHFNSSSIAVRLCVLREVLDSFKKVPSHDDTFHLVSAILADGDLRFDARPLTGYRIHDANRSTIRASAKQGQRGPTLARHPEVQAILTLDILKLMARESGRTDVTRWLEREQAYLRLLGQSRGALGGRLETLVCIAQLGRRAHIYDPAMNIMAALLGLLSLLSPALLRRIYHE